MIDIGQYFHRSLPEHAKIYSRDTPVSKAMHQYRPIKVEIYFLLIVY